MGTCAEGVGIPSPHPTIIDCALKVTTLRVQVSSISHVPWFPCVHQVSGYLLVYAYRLLQEGSSLRIPITMDLGIGEVPSDLGQKNIHFIHSQAKFRQ